MKNVGLVPLLNFGEVLPDIYRCAQPLYPHQYQWIRDVLGVKNIVNLRKESSHDEIFSKLGFNVLHINVVDHEPPTLKQAKDFIKYIQSLKEPVLIHCAHGHGRTSTFSVLAKIAKGWNLHPALRDENTRFHHMWRHQYQLEFLKKHFL